MLISKKIVFVATILFSLVTQSSVIASQTPTQEPDWDISTETVDMQSLKQLTYLPFGVESQNSFAVKGDYDGDGVADFILRDPVKLYHYVLLSKDKTVQRAKFG